MHNVLIFFIHSSTTSTTTEPPDVTPSLDPNASKMLKEDAQPSKRHCPSQSLDD